MEHFRHSAKVGARPDKAAGSQLGKQYQNKGRKSPQNLCGLVGVR